MTTKKMAELLHTLRQKEPCNCGRLGGTCVRHGLEEIIRHIEEKQHYRDVLEEALIELNPDGEFYSPSNAHNFCKNELERLNSTKAGRSGAILCDHANESPSTCPCQTDCYCYVEGNCGKTKMRLLSIPSRTMEDKLQNIHKRESHILAIIKKLLETEIHRAACWGQEINDIHILQKELENEYREDPCSVCGRNTGGCCTQEKK